MKAHLHHIKSMVIAILTSTALLTACSNDNEEDLLGDGDDTDECDTQSISLADDIQPIIAANCAISNCHVTGGQAPDLTQKQNILSSATAIRTRTSNGSMPPAQSGLSLTSEQISLISCWVENGAQDN